jgi:hypothetical protein
MKLMLLVFIAQVTAAAAAVDTTQVAAAQRALIEVLTLSFPWMDGAVVAYLSKLLAGFPIVTLIFSWEFIAKKSREASPWLNEHIGKRFEKWGFIINPILGALIGWKMGDATLGLAGGALWSMIRSAFVSLSKGQVDPASAVKVKVAAALLLCGSLWVAAPTHADEPKPSSFRDRLTMSAGGGVRRDFVADAPAIGFLALQPGFTLSNHVALRFRVAKDFDSGGDYSGELAAWFVF